MRRSRATAFLLALLTVCLAGAPAEKPTVRVHGNDGVLSVHGRFSVRAPRDACWRVLVDYEHIPRFVSSVHSSHVVTRSGDRAVVEQRITTQVLFVHTTVGLTLDVREMPRHRIVFRDTSGKDFELYLGSWTLTPGALDPGTTIVDYQLEAHPRTDVPDFLGERLLEAGAATLLDEVRGEMARAGGAR